MLAMIGPSFTSIEKDNDGKRQVLHQDLNLNSTCNMHLATYLSYMLTWWPNILSKYTYSQISRTCRASESFEPNQQGGEKRKRNKQET